MFTILEKKKEAANQKNHINCVLTPHLYRLYASMESCQQPANDSFSYAWLIHRTPATIAGDVEADEETSSFFDVEERWLDSRRPSCEAGRDFEFGVGASPPAAPLLHADQLFSNGLLLPLHLLSPPPQPPPPLHVDHQAATTADLDVVLGRASSGGATKRPVMERWRRWSKKVWKKCLALFKPLCRCGGRGRGRRPAAGKVRPETVSCPESLSTLARTNSTSDAGDLLLGEVVLDSNVERSIYEAVLHCKKSIE